MRCRCEKVLRDVQSIPAASGFSAAWLVYQRESQVSRGEPKERFLFVGPSAAEKVAF